MRSQLLASGDLAVCEGQPHPDCHRQLGISANDLLAYCGVPFSSLQGFFDAVAHTWKFPPPAPYKFRLPCTLLLPRGANITVLSSTELFRLVLKCRCPAGGAACTCECTCAPAGGWLPGSVPKKVGGACSVCSFAVQAQVESPSEPPCSLHGAGYVSSTAAEPLQLALALLASSDGWPEHFAAGRSDGDGEKAQVVSANRNVQSAKPFPSGPLAGLNFAFGVSCSSPGCTAHAWLGGNVDAPNELEVRFSGSCEHSSVLRCKQHPEEERCADCVAAGVLPLPAPYGSLSGLQGAVSLEAARCALAALHAGREASPTALSAAAARIVGPRALFSGCRAICGSGADNFKRLLAEETRRTNARCGLTQPLPPELGGPETSEGRELELLVRPLSSLDEHILTPSDSSSSSAR